MARDSTGCRTFFYLLACYCIDLVNGLDNDAQVAFNWVHCEGANVPQSWRSLASVLDVLVLTYSHIWGIKTLLLLSGMKWVTT